VNGRRPELSLAFFAAGGDEESASKYQLMFEATKLADESGFHAVWVPERHFQRFGGLYPSAAVAAAAVAATTKRIQVRAGSVVIPLNEAIRVAEEWSMVDNLSGGRAGIAIASGWHVDDFVLNPSAYERRFADVTEKVALIRRLWKGERITLPNGAGKPIEVGILPRPVQAELPMWLTAGSDEGFRQAGLHGFNVLTANFRQKERASKLKQRIDIYRAAIQEHHGRRGLVTLMTHAYAADPEKVERFARPALREYLASMVDLLSAKEASVPKAEGKSLAAASESKKDFVLDFGAISHIKGQLSFIGTLDRCRDQARALGELGVDEIACLIDFGIPFAESMESLRLLTQL
jgi:natural product biosynthesis luciferase-like monooxygenase protein